MKLKNCTVHKGTESKVVWLEKSPRLKEGEQVVINKETYTVKTVGGLTITDIKNLPKGNKETSYTFPSDKKKETKKPTAEKSPAKKAATKKKTSTKKK